MLYFTYASGRVRGVFSGRFAFRDWDTNVEGTSAPIERVERSQRQHYGETLLHEEMHHRVTRHSTLNQWIVGDRFLTRIAFWSGNDNQVVRHYVIRTVYFALSYELHEQLVDRLVSEQRIDLTLDELGRIVQADNDVRTTLAAMRHPVRSGPRNWLGQIATREFAVVLTERDGTNARLREGASRAGLGGVFNAAFQPSPSDRLHVRMIKALHRTVNIERIARAFGRRMDTVQLRRWAEIKLRTEWQALHHLNKLQSDRYGTELPKRPFPSALQGRAQTIETYFSDYLRAILPFAVRFGRTPTRGEISNAYDLADALLPLLVDGRPFAELSAEQLDVFDAAAGFFFYHGN